MIFRKFITFSIFIVQLLFPSTIVMGESLSYKLEELPFDSFGSFSCASSINDNGHVTGIVSYLFHVYPFYWDGKSEPKTLDFILYSLPTISNGNRIACSYLEKGWMSTATKGCVWNPVYGFAALPPHDGWDTVNVVNQNDQGDLLIINKNRPSTYCTIIKNIHASVAIFREGAYINIPNMEDATAINRNVILGVGYKVVKEREISFPILYDLENRATQILPFEGNAVGVDINDLGQVIGYYEDQNDRLKGFFWDPNQGFLLLDFLPQSINDKGQIVGCDIDHHNIYLWEDNQVYALQFQTDVPKEDINKIIVKSINNHGEIVGGLIKNSTFLKAIIFRPFRPCCDCP